MDYRDIPGINPSTLVHGLVSMRRLKRIMDLGGDYKRTDAMVLGTTTHALLLEPDEFESRFCVMPDFHLEAGNVTANGKPTDSTVTNYVKQRRNEFACAMAGYEIVKADQYEAALKMIRSLRGHHSAGEYFTDAVFEEPVIGTIEGVLAKGRTDIVRPRHCQLIDVKTTNSLSQFGRRFASLNYAFRLAFYRELLLQSTGRTFDVFIIAQEDRDDFDTAVFQVPDIVLDNALGRVKKTMRRYTECMTKRVWPGWDNGEPLAELDIPNWSMAEEDVLDWESV